MELLAPVGNIDKLKLAIHYGADAVYLASKRFGLRTFAGNFEIDELEWAVDFVHSAGKKIYVTEYVSLLATLVVFWIDINLFENKYLPLLSAFNFKKEVFNDK